MDNTSPKSTTELSDVIKQAAEDLKREEEEAKSLEEIKREYAGTNDKPTR